MILISYPSLQVSLVFPCSFCWILKFMKRTISIGLAMDGMIFVFALSTAVRLQWIMSHAVFAGQNRVSHTKNLYKSGRATDLLILISLRRRTVFQSELRPLRRRRWSSMSTPVTRPRQKPVKKQEVRMYLIFLRLSYVVLWTSGI